MKFRDQSLIPPGCPSSLNREVYIDAGRAEFSLDILPWVTDGQEDIVEATALFRDQIDPANGKAQAVAASETLSVGEHSDFGYALAELGEEVDNDPSAAGSIRAALLQRIEECHGVIQADGRPVCWALSAGGLREVLEQRLIHPPDTPEVS